MDVYICLNINIGTVMKNPEIQHAVKKLPYLLR